MVVTKVRFPVWKGRSNAKEASRETAFVCERHPAAEVDQLTVLSNLAFLFAAYAHLQPHQLLPQPSSKQPQPQFVAQQQPQPPRPAPQVQSQPQLAPVSPSLALQSSPEDHAMPLGPVTQALPLQCSTAHVHKPGISQQCQLPTLDTGSQHGHPEGGSHAPQRRFQHTSAVILQMQPASPVVSKLVSRHWGQQGGPCLGWACTPDSRYINVG